MNCDYESSRWFQLWDYSVSLAQLLIRSPRDEADPNSSNEDLVASGVFYMGEAKGKQKGKGSKRGQVSLI